MTTGIKVVYPVCAAFFLIAFFAPEFIMRIFSNETAVVSQGIKYMQSFCFDYLLVPFVFCMNGLFTGSGRTTFTMIHGTITSVIIRAPIALLLGKALDLGLIGIGLAAPIATFGSLIACSVYFMLGRWKKSNIIK